MAKNAGEFNEAKVRELIAANQGAVQALQDEIDRLRTFLELTVLKAASSPNQLIENIRRSEELLKKAELIRAALQAAIDSLPESTRQALWNPDSE